MDPEIFYADLELPGFSSSTSKRNSGLVQPSEPQPCPRWHRIALRTGLIGNILLLVILTAMGTWVMTRKTTGTAALPSHTHSRHAGGEGNETPEAFRSFLKLNLCDATRSSTGNEKCHLCAMTWYLHKDKCYWISNSIQSWKKSKEDCVSRKAHLLVIDHLEEQEFIQKKTKPKTVWAEFSNLLSRKPQNWASSSPFNPTLLPRVPVEEGSCCSLGEKATCSEMCTTELHWICEKPSVVI